MFALLRLRQSIPRVPFAAIRFASSNGTNDVTLIGSVYSGLLNIGHGTSQFYFKTNDNKTDYTVHNVYVSGETLKVLEEPIAKEQKLLISGRLRTQKFKRHDGKARTLLRVQARTLYTIASNDEQDVLDDDADDSQSTTLDRNHVELRGQICFDIAHFEKFSNFTLANHYALPDQTMGTAFLDVFAYGDYLKEYVRQNLNRLDYVRVTGPLKYKATMDDKGKRKYIGYIRADSICKIIPLLSSLPSHD